MVGDSSVETEVGFPVDVVVDEETVICPVGSGVGASALVGALVGGTASG